jgi:hypothetical protein
MVFSPKLMAYSVVFFAFARRRGAVLAAGFASAG